MFKVASVGVLMMLATPAIAQNPVTDAPASQEVASSDNSDVNRVVCKKEETLGSRLGGKRLCLTVKEWQERAQLNREETERVQRDSGQRSSN